jgi:fructose-specific component phosphotransferase system IIB-like protein
VFAAAFTADPSLIANMSQTQFVLLLGSEVTAKDDSNGTACTAWWANQATVPPLRQALEPCSQRASA